MIALCAGVAVIQTSLLGAVSIKGIKPDLFLCLAVVSSALSKEEKGVITGWLVGMARGFSSLQPVGLDAVLFVLVGYSIVRVRGYLFVEHPITLFILILVAGTLCVSVRTMWAWGSEWNWAQVFRDGLAETIYTAFVTGVGSFVVSEVAVLIKALRGARTTR